MPPNPRSQGLRCDGTIEGSAPAASTITGFRIHPPRNRTAAAQPVAPTRTTPPVRTPRVRSALRTSAGSGYVTRVYRFGAISIRPSLTNDARASRIGVWDTPSQLIMSERRVAARQAGAVKVHTDMPATKRKREGCALRKFS